MSKSLCPILRENKQKLLSLYPSKFDQNFICMQMNIGQMCFGNVSTHIRNLPTSIYCCVYNIELLSYVVDGTSYGLQWSSAVVDPCRIFIIVSLIDI